MDRPMFSTQCLMYSRNYFDDDTSNLQSDVSRRAFSTDLVFIDDVSTAS